MDNASRWVVAFFGITFIAAIGAFLQGSWLLGGCSELVVSRLPRPDGVSEVRVAVVNCGATSGFVTIIGVVAPTHVGDLGADYFFAIKGTEALTVRWVGDGRLSVRARSEAEVIRKAVIWHQLQIQYE